MHSLFSSRVPFSFTFSHSVLLLLSCFLRFHLSNFHVTFSSLLICQFQFCFSLFLRLLFFCVCLLLPLSLLFPLCLVLDMLPKTTSTLCFPLLTLECKRQREEEKELQKIDSPLWHVLTLKNEQFPPVVSVFLPVTAKYWPTAVILFH